MIGTILALIFLCMISSIITEQLIIRRLKISPGIDYKNGMCVLKSGFGKLDA